MLLGFSVLYLFDFCIKRKYVKFVLEVIYIKTNTRLPHKEWGCKDDLKLFEYDVLEFKWSFLPWMWSHGLFIDSAKKERSL